ncbi:MAG: signal peptidase I [Coriobacteriia bacterium]|nr:signal peptidase I [Coriobacteriia bacterium]
MSDDRDDYEDIPPSVTEVEAVNDSAPVRTSSHSAGFGRWLLETAIMVGLAFLLAQGIKTFVIQPFVIPTGSMEPTIMIGDRVLAEKISYRFETPSVGDIVVFDDPSGVYPQLIKRVVAVGGQTVDVRDGGVYIDDVPLDEPYIRNARTELATLQLPITIPEDQVWLMGDNRPNSQDSRFFGPQPVSMVKGRAFGIYWPVDHITGL